MANSPGKSKTVITENLQNAGDLLREFKEEYGRDNRKVR